MADSSSGASALGGVFEWLVEWEWRRVKGLFVWVFFFFFMFYIITTVDCREHGDF